ncbi:MAG: VanZ family protein [Lachnospiraceae bacterium]|nr:VanZ family protein [Lachnospiraceae bacterium]
MKQHKRQFLHILLACIWMITIFWFSSRTGDDSSAQSSTIVGLIEDLLSSIRSHWSADTQQAFVSIVTLLVRKAAHATEYLILGLLFLGSQSRNRPLKKAVPAAWILAVCYAATDEIHQYFVPGRACRFTDVIIDSCGAAAGLLVFCLIHRYRSRNKS